MFNGNQEGSDPPAVPPGVDDPFPAPLEGVTEPLPPPPRVPGAPDIPSDPTGRSRHPGLVPWLVLLTVFGGGATLAGQPEASVLVGIAGMFVSAQGADLDLAWRRIYHLVSWVVPVSGMLGFALLAQFLWTGDVPQPARLIVTVFAGASAVLCMLTGLRPVSNALIRMWFRGETPSHTLRLAARLVMMGLLVGVPAWFLFRGVVSKVLADPSTFINPASLAGGLVGYITLAFASVGFLVRRSWRATLERLGLEPLRPRDALVVLAGVLVVFAFNATMEWIQRAAFPALWESDQAFGRSLSQHMGPAQIVLLGLSAGIGEEITMRGALQPRLGILFTSVLFAMLHVQYSWFGMVVILMLGIVLGTLRRLTSTSVAIAVHALFDMLAVFSVLPRH